MENRRDFIKKSAIAGAGMALSASTLSKTFANIANGKKIRLAIIGTGSRGKYLMELLLAQKVNTNFELVVNPSGSTQQRTGKHQTHYSLRLHGKDVINSECRSPRLSDYVHLLQSEGLSDLMEFLDKVFNSPERLVLRII